MLKPIRIANNARGEAPADCAGEAAHVPFFPPSAAVSSKTSPKPSWLETPGLFPRWRRAILAASVAKRRATAVATTATNVSNLVSVAKRLACSGVECSGSIGPKMRVCQASDRTWSTGDAVRRATCATSIWETAQNKQLAPVAEATRLTPWPMGKPPVARSHAL